MADEKMDAVKAWGDVAADLRAQVASLTDRAEAAERERDNFQVMYTETVDVLASLRVEHQRALELLRQHVKEQWCTNVGDALEDCGRCSYCRAFSFLKGSG
jgi:hypothetical protein